MITNVIGLGQAGCNIADVFAKTASNYKAYKLDVGLTKSARCFPLKAYSEPEGYEANPPKLKTFFKNIHGEVLFVVGGGGDVSNAALVVLEQLKHCKTRILYVKPDLSFLGIQERLQENMVFGILQELARSGVFERLFIVSNPHIEEVLGGIPLIGYFDKLNETIVSTFHMIDTLKNMKPVTGTESKPPIGARISTFGFVDLEKNVDKMFFPLDIPTDMVYLYAYNQTELEERKDLLNEVKTQMKKRNEEGEKRVTFNIYATDYEETFVYFLGHTSIVQTNYN